MKEMDTAGDSQENDSVNLVKDLYILLTVSDRSEKGIIR